ncbi:E3 ubiquitin-protein ligase MARCH3 [Eumeta japonica]|uniref:E3 ubiquitin-protein ligase MARCH3 n=1 Tax=Eumeta variegata TaxID=151549 RepID=A0A4C1ZAH4_EUMVA|nr:E3 ubiquitin-protein ligase MARCH3 [Eumeta japonica]
MRSTPNDLKYEDPLDLSQQTKNESSDLPGTQKSTGCDNRTLNKDSSSSMFYETRNSGDENTLSMANKVRVKSNYREKTRDRHSVQRMKIRSPKRRTTIVGPKDNEKCNIGVDSIDWGKEILTGAFEAQIVCDRPSDHSTDSMCRICHGSESGSLDFGPLISACCCRGTIGRIHVKCLERWLTESGKSRCELCGSRYATRRFHRYGILKALLMWMLSQNTKQLLVDIFGIMLMSPLALLAAWLSGKTLSGLVTPERSATPWPLASTFVLACMTLVRPLYLLVSTSLPFVTQHNYG